MAGLSEIGPRQSVDEAHELASGEGARGQASDVTDHLQVEGRRQLPVLESPDRCATACAAAKSGERRESSRTTRRLTRLPASAASSAARRGQVGERHELAARVRVRRPSGRARRASGLRPRP